MTSGEAMLVRIESMYMASIDIVTTNMFNLSQTIMETKAISVSGIWYRVNYPEQLFLIAKSTGLGTSYSVSY